MFIHSIITSGSYLGSLFIYDDIFDCQIVNIYKTKVVLHNTQKRITFKIHTVNSNTLGSIGILLYMIINTELPPFSTMIRDVLFGNSNNNNNDNDDFITADQWYYTGRRVPYDVKQRRIVSTSNKNDNNVVQVFEKVVSEPQYVNVNTRWITFLPGMPNGSYGYSKIENEISSSRRSNLPRLYIEYIGHGDSDTLSIPIDGDKNNKNTNNIGYSIMERVDLVLAQWRAHQVRRTVIVSYDYSSLIVVELLRRHQEQRETNTIPYTMIEHIMIINGPLLYNNINSANKVMTATSPRILKPVIEPLAKRSNYILDAMILKQLYSIQYQNKYGKKILRQEMKETRNTIRRHHNDTMILSKKFIIPINNDIENSNNNNNTSSPKKLKNDVTYYKKRWDISSIYTEYCVNHGITIDFICSIHHIYENQYHYCKEQIGDVYYPNIRYEFIHSGHMILYEHVSLLNQKILHLSNKQNSYDTVTTNHSWITMQQPYNSNQQKLEGLNIPTPTKTARSWVTLRT